MTAVDDHTGRLSEIFASFQGEGSRVGEPQLFVRFAGCDRNCRFCDTPNSRAPDAASTVMEISRGKRWRRANPWSPAELAEVVDGYKRLPVCLTGGEPLLQAEFIAGFAGLLKPGRRLILETHGLDADAMKSLSGIFHAVCADAKLPSSTGEPTDWDEFSAFLRAAGPEKTNVKAVVTSSTTMADVIEAMDRVACVSASMPFVIQPVTPANGVLPPDADALLEMAIEGLARLEEVRVLPQVHRLTGWK